MSRPPRPETKRTLAILSDGKPRSLDQIAKEAEIDAATAYEVVRSLTKQREVHVYSMVTHYTISQSGLSRAERVKKYDEEVEERAQRKRQAATDRMRRLREREKDQERQEFRVCTKTMVRAAVENQHPLAMAWGREVAA